MEEAIDVMTVVYFYPYLIQRIKENIQKNLNGYVGQEQKVKYQIVRMKQYARK